MSIEIREVPLATVWHIRKTVMYPELDLDAVKLKDDANGVHLGLFDNDSLCSVVSLFYQEDDLQFRKFATFTHLQRKGYGTYLLQAVFAQAKEKEVKRIWCNARTTATALYRKFGMQPFGETWNERGHQFVKMQINL